MPAKKPKKKVSYIIPLTTIGIVSLLITVSLVNFAKKSNSNSVPTLNTESNPVTDLIDLPFPAKDSRFSLEKALNQRRSYTTYQDQPITLADLSQLLWAAQGITADWGGRTVPSAKSIYPLTVFAIVNQVTGLDQGLYKYIPGNLQPAHQLFTLYRADLRSVLLENTNQYSLQHAPLILIITTNTDKTEAYLEAGHTAQNLYLQATGLGLGMAEINNLEKDILKEILEIPQEETIIYLIPLGFPKK